MELDVDPMKPTVDPMEPSIEAVEPDIDPLEPSIDPSDVDYRAFLESTPLVPWEADAQTWCFTYVGPQAESLLGFPVEDWYDPSFWTNRIHVDDREEAIATCTRLSAVGCAYDFDYRMLRSDGSVIWVHDMVTVEMGEAGPLKLRGFLIDITESKALSDALVDAEAKLRTVLQEAPEALLLVGADGMIIQNNRQAERLFDLTGEELRGSPIEHLVPERLRGNHVKYRDGFVNDPRRRPMGAEIPLVARRSDGFEIPVEISLSPVEFGGEHQVLASIRDVSEMTRMTMELVERERLLQISSSTTDMPSGSMWIPIRSWACPFTTCSARICTTPYEPGSRRC